MKVNLFAFFSGLSTWLILGPSLPPLWGGRGGGVKDRVVMGCLPGRQETDGGADEAKVSERPPAAVRSSRPLEDTRPVLLLSPPQGQWRAEGGGDQSWGGGGVRGAGGGWRCQADNWGEEIWWMEGALLRECDGLVCVCVPPRLLS